MEPLSLTVVVVSTCYRSEIRVRASSSHSVKRWRVSELDVGRLRNSGHHKTCKIAALLHFISRNGPNGPRIQSVDEKRVCALACVCVCVHELMLLHTRQRPVHLPLKQKGLRHLFSFFFFLSLGCHFQVSLSFFFLGGEGLSKFKMLTLYKELFAFLFFCFISGLSYKEMLQ